MKQSFQSLVVSIVSMIIHTHCTQHCQFFQHTACTESPMVYQCSRSLVQLWNIAVATDNTFKIYSVNTHCIKFTMPKYYYHYELLTLSTLGRESSDVPSVQSSKLGMEWADFQITCLHRSTVHSIPIYNFGQIGCSNLTYTLPSSTVAQVKSHRKVCTHLDKCSYILSHL